jgi:ureidoacrylate peracid hydrolase
MARFRGIEDLAGDGSALLLVDLQNDYLHPEGAIGRHLDPDAVLAMMGIVEVLRVEAAQAGIPAVFLRTLHTPLTDSPAWLERDSDKVCREGTFGAGFFLVEPEANDTVLTKHRYSGFIGTPLDQVLRRLGVHTLVIVGVGSNVCVESTLRDAFMLDYRVILVEDGTVGEADLHEATLENVRRHFGLVVSHRDVVSMWGRAGS